MKELPFDTYDFFGYIASGLILIALSQLVFGFPKVFAADLKPFDLAVTILTIYVAGQIVAGPAKFLFEDLVVHKILGSPTTNLLRSNTPLLRRTIFPGYYKTLPPAIRAKLAAKIDALQIKNAGPEDIFLTIRYAPEVVSNEPLIDKINAFRNMYGFNRNVSFSLLFAAFCLGIVERVKASPSLSHFSIAALICGILLFYRYLKFFRQYSFELFNWYACATQKEGA